MSENKQRIAIGRRLINEFRITTGLRDTLETDAIDAIADILHYVATKGIDIQTVARIAVNHTVEES
jgi:hypothetical protein